MSRIALAAVMLGGFAMLCLGPAQAAAELKYEHYWLGAPGGPALYTTYEQAVAALRSGPALRAKLDEWGEPESSADGSLRYQFFRVPDEPRLPTAAPFYMFGGLCDEAECTGEGEVIARRLAELAANGACNHSLSPSSGWYDVGLSGISTPVHVQGRNYLLVQGKKSGASCLPLPDQTLQVQRWQPITACTGTFQAHSLGASLEQQVCREQTLQERTQTRVVKCCAKTVGNPVNVGSGAKQETVVDYRSPSLELVRHYNSLDQTRRVGWGAGWSHNWNKRLILDAADVPRLYVLGNGDAVRLAPSGTATWVAVSSERAVTVTKSASGTVYLVRGTDGLLEVYGATTGRWYQWKDRSDRLVATLAYRPDGRLATVTDDAGRTLTFTYDADHRLVQVTDPAGGVYQYGFTANGSLVSVNSPSGETTTYHYELAAAPGRLTGVTDGAGLRVATFGYDAKGRANLTERAGGTNRYTLSYLADGTTRVTDPAGAVVDYAFAEIQGTRRPSGTVGDVAAGYASMSYNASGYLTQATDLRGTVTTWTRDGKGREISRTEAAGTPEARTTTTVWHATLMLPAKVIEPGRETEYQYSATGNLLSETVRDIATGETRTTTHSYTAEGRRETMDGPRTDVLDITRWEYDAQGNVSEVIDALGRRTRYTYDVHVNPETITDPNGLVSTLTYDANQRLIRRSVAGAETAYDYTADGLLKKTTAPDGSTLDYHHDAAHRLIAIADGQGHRIEYTLDARGNRLEERTKDASGTLTRRIAREFNALNQLTKLIVASGKTEYAYDAAGNRVSVKDPLDRTTASAFDPLNRLTQVTDAAGGITRNAFDARGNLVEVIDPKGVTTRYVYDGFDQVLRVESPDAGTTHYTYDAAGNRVSQTDARGVTAQYTYDALNRLTAIRYPDSSLDIVYLWDTAPNGVGKLASIQDGPTQIDYQYDSRGRVSEERRTIEGVALSIGYAYDAADRLSMLIYPSGARVVYARDAAGQVQSVTLHRPDGTTASLATGISYQPFGPLAGYTDGAGREHARGYDLDGRLTSLDTLGVQGLSYAYDPAGNPVSITDLLAPQNNQTFGYDRLDRLTSATGIYGNQAWTYDPVGNRLSENNGGAIEGYNYAIDSHRLLAAGRRSYQYDAAGNTVSDDRFSYVYDARNRLSEVWSAGRTTRLARYAHNSQGQRILKVAGAPDTTDYAGLAAAAQLQADQHRAAGDAQVEAAAQANTQADAKDTEAAEARAAQDAALGAAATYRAEEAETRAEAEAAFAAAGAAADAARLAGVAADMAAEQAGQAATVATLQAIALREQAEAARAAASAAHAEGGTLSEAAAQARTDAAAQEAYALDQFALKAALEIEAQAQLALEAQLRADAAELLAEAEPELAKARFFRAKIITPPKNVGQKVTNLVFELLAQMFERRVDDLTTEAAEKLAQADAAYAASLAASAEAEAAGERSAAATELAIALRAQAETDEAQATALFAEAETLNQQAAQASAQAGILEAVALQQATARDVALAEAASLYAQEAAIHATAETALAQANAEADALHALAEAKDAEAIAVEQQSIAATNAAIDLRAQAAEANEAAAEAYLLADAAQTEADHYRYLADNPPNTEQIMLFAYDSAGHLIGEYDESGNLLREHVWLGDLPLAMLTLDATFNVQADHLNTPTSMTDSAGALVWQANREPFGETALAVAAVEQNLRFPGQYFDQETGLHQNWHREYDPAVVRYTQSDPIGLKGGANVYVYTSQSPTSSSDSSGLLASHHHYFLTLAALADNQECSGSFVIDVAEESVAFDYISGSQEVTNSHWHAMRRPRQSAQDAAEMTNAKVRELLNECTSRGLGSALHIVQDMASQSHRNYQEYNGIVGPGHLVHDIYPDEGAVAEAAGRSRALVAMFRKLCPCACK